MTKTKLKIGLLLNSYRVPNWQFKIIERLKNSDFADIKLIIINNTPIIKKSVGFFYLINRANNIIFNTYLKLDQFILGRATNYSKKLDLKSLLSDVSVITLAPHGDGLVNKLNNYDVIKIKCFNLDIILKFDFRQQIRSITAIPKYGVWLYGSGNRTKDTEQFDYWALMKKFKTTSITLKIFNENSDSGSAIYCSQLLTNSISISKNQNFCYRRACTIIPRTIKGLHDFGEPYLLKLKSKYENKVNFFNSETAKLPAPFTALGNVLVHIWKINKRLLRKLFYVDHWDVLYKINSKEVFVSSLSEFTMLSTPSDRFWADPFVVTKGDKHFIFVEELLYKKNKGHIAVIEIDNEGNCISSKKILEKSYHLSYPFLTKFDDTYYMIPETGENKTIELYKCIEFPYRWEFVMNLMENTSTADATLFYYNNKWWLFCCVDDSGLHEGLLDELHLFYSDTLFSKNWKSHPGNPISSDTRTARPAGEIFIRDNKIYRPSQDCSGIYGRGMNLNEIVKLSETEYEEVVVKKVFPQDDSAFMGTHTFNASDAIKVIDGFQYRRRRRFF